jgi:hypothetical protein
LIGHLASVVCSLALGLSKKVQVSQGAGFGCGVVPRFEGLDYVILKMGQPYFSAHAYTPDDELMIPQAPGVDN